MKAYVIDPRSCETIRQLNAMNWDLCPDALDTEPSSVTVSGSVPTDWNGKLLLLEGALFVIGPVAPGKSGSTKLSLLLPDSLFDRDLIYAPSETTPQTIGDFLAAVITSEWIRQPDPVYALPKLTVSSSDAAPFQAPEADEESGVYSFLDYLRGMRRDCGVTLGLSLTGDGIAATISQAAPQEHSLRHDDGHTTVESLVWASNGVAKITTIQPVDTGEVDEEDQKIYENETRNWYLSAEGVPSETPPQARAEGSWELLPVSENDDPAEKAAERFRQSRSSEHKIELHSDAAMAVGDSFRLRYEGSVYSGTVAAIRLKSGESRPLYRSGELATTLTDKVRSISKGVKT